MNKKKIKAAVELGRKGGLKTLKLYGREHFIRAVNKRWEKYRKEKENAQKTEKLP